MKSLFCFPSNASESFPTSNPSRSPRVAPSNLARYAIWNL